MMNKCPVIGCEHLKPRRYVLCGGHFAKVPNDVRSELRVVLKEKNGTRIPQTLRVQPSRQWFERVIKYVGQIKIPYIMGFGITAVKIAADRSEV